MCGITKTSCFAQKWQADPPLAQRARGRRVLSRASISTRAPTHGFTDVYVCRFPARVGDAVARDTTVTFRPGIVGRRERGGEIQKGNKRGIAVPSIRLHVHKRIHTMRTPRMYVRRTRTYQEGILRRQLLSHKEREKERREVQVDRTEIRIKNASRRALAKGEGRSNAHTRASRCVCVCVERGSPNRGHSICSVQNTHTHIHTLQLSKHTRERDSRVREKRRERQKDRQRKTTTSEVEGTMKKEGRPAECRGQSRCTHEHPASPVVPL